MKANELTLGDFLRYKQDFPHPHLKGKIVKVCGIRGRLDIRTIDDGFFSESEHPDWLEPIPITPEILEKNGWERVLTEEDGLFTLYALSIKPSKPDRDYTQVVIYFYDEEIFEVKTLVEIQCSSSKKGVNSFHSCDCEYIHQLQAAMRLCGIEKEIEL